LTKPITDTIFPVLAATHQVNRVAALAVSAAEMIEFGKFYMAQIVKNSKALGKALDERGIPILCANKGYSQSHQIIAKVHQYGGGLEVAHRLAQANIITNKNLVPEDKPEDWDHPNGLRIGTIEVTRLGMNENDMETIAEFIARVLVEGEDPESVGKDVIDFRLPKQTLYYNFDYGYPEWARI
jgi:glycine hydroxymethyltransferase